MATNTTGNDKIVKHVTITSSFHHMLETSTSRGYQNRCRRTETTHQERAGVAVIERVVGERRQRLRSCVRTGDEHLEHDVKMM